MKNLLILTLDNDPHADYIYNIIKSKGGLVYRLNTNNLHKNYFISFDSNNLEFKIKDSDSNREIVINNSWNIWNRRLWLPALNEDFDGIKNPSLVELIFNETKKTWDALLMMHKGKVIDNPLSIARGDNKIEQLSFVKNGNYGVEVPETVVSNNPLDVLNFYNKHKEICFKLHKGVGLKIDDTNYIVYTNKVKPENLKNISAVRLNPSMFQEYIEKDYELRITVIGNEVIPIAIYSQDSEISKVDFRRYDFEKVKYEYKKVPDEVSNLCLAMLSHYGLNFGAFDFIKDKKGRYIFLELNPNGQWLWLEQLSGYKISEVLADYLISYP